MESFADAPSRDGGDLEEAAALLSALAHPVRLRILEGLLNGQCCVGNMVDCLGLPQPLVSRHLAILREAGILECEAEGRRRTYRVTHPRAESLVRNVLGPPPQERKAT